LMPRTTIGHAGKKKEEDLGKRGGRNPKKTMGGIDAKVKGEAKNDWEQGKGQVLKKTRQIKTNTRQKANVNLARDRRSDRKGEKEMQEDRHNGFHSHIKGWWDGKNGKTSDKTQTRRFMPGLFPIQKHWRGHSGGKSGARRENLGPPLHHTTGTS